MAKPLRAFRKYQKQMLVFFGVLLMIAFILGGVLTSMPNYSPGREPQDSINVRWDGASYSEEDLAVFLNSHILSQQFLIQLATQAQSQGALPRTDPSLVGVSNDRDAGLRDAANILLLADEANRLGFNISDDVVNNFLSRVCDNAFSEGDYMELLKQTAGGQLTMPRLREHLKTELAALRLQDILFSGMGSLGGQVNQFGVMALPPEPFVTPLSAVVSQQRINNTAKIEFLPIEVEPFLAKVTDKPSNRTIKELYDRGAVRFPDFEKKVPGFRKPDRAKVQWFKIDQDAFLPPVDSITEEAIQAEYDRRVAAKDLSVIDSRPTPPPLNPTDETGVSTPDQPEGEGSAPAEGGSETETGEGAGEAGKDDKPETGGGEADKTEAGPGDGNSETTDGTGNDNSDQTDGQQSSLEVKGSAQSAFVSLPVGPQDPQETEGSQTPPETTTPPETQTTPPVQDPATLPGETPQEPPVTTEPPSQEDEGPKFKPLEEVRDSIVDALRRQAAGEKRNKSLDEIMERLDDYFVDHEIWEAESIEEKGLPAPAPPDFKAMAEKYGISFDETNEALDFVEFSETELGQAFGEFPRNQMNFQNFPTVARLMFEGFRDAKVYRPQMTLLRDHIYWINEKLPQHVPSLDECRDDVVRFWKWDKAVELAEAEAQAKLKKGSSLAAEFPEEAFESQTFSWLSVGGGNMAMGGGQLSLSSVNYMDGEELKSLDSLGNEFMQQVFDLNVGQGGIAMDGLRETVFAVQVVEKDTSPELAETAVKNQTQPALDARRVVGTDIGQFRSDWVADLEKRRDVRWTVKKVN